MMRAVVGGPAGHCGSTDIIITRTVVVGGGITSFPNAVGPSNTCGRVGVARTVGADVAVVYVDIGRTSNVQP